MKKFYTSPQVDILLVSMEEGACITTSMTENEGFTPVPGSWDTSTI